MDILKSQNAYKAKKSDSYRKQLSSFYRSNDEYILKILDTLIIDFYNHLPHNKSTLADQKRDRHYIKKCLEHRGLSYATKCLPKLADSLFQYLETGKSSYPSFKLQKGTEHPAFMRQFFDMIYNSSYCESNQTWAIACIYQISYAFKKLRGPYDPNVLVKQFDDFCTVDQSLSCSNWDYDTINWAINDVNNIFDNVSPSNLMHFHPGPGATNTPTKKHMRYEPHVLYKQIDDVLWYEDIFLPSYSAWTRQAQNFRKLPRKEAPTSRFRFVDKVFSKPRGICIEENEMQYVQQGVKEFLYDHFEKHTLTKGKFNFRDQTVNQQLALKGSVDRTYATIDMSEASDRISRKLVYAIFRNQPDWLDVLKACSTTTIVAPKDIAEKVKTPILLSKKFAPMGSGLCFPIMTLVHFILVRGIIMCSNLRNKHDLIKEIYVYGDDIILPSECVEAVFSELPKYGMKLNMDKSFYSGHFRESCGLHAYKGREITPIFIKKINLKARSTGTLLSVLASEFWLRKKGLTQTANVIRTMVTDSEGLLPTVNPGSPVLGYGDPTGYSHVSDVLTPGVRVRFSRNVPNKPYTQEYEYRVRVVEPRKVCNPPMDGFSGLMRKLVSHDTFATVSSEVAKDEFKISWRWLSASAIVR